MGPIVVSADITIIGAGDETRLSGLDRARVLKVVKRTTVTLRGVHITRGFASVGGGIMNAGTLHLADSRVSRSRAWEGAGGGIFNFGGILVVRRSTIAGNRTLVGGGIDNFDGGTVRLIDVTVTRNRANFGGGVGNEGGTITIRRSTVSGNEARGLGGGIDSGGEFGIDSSVSLIASTVSGNTARDGGGIYNAVTLTLARSTVSGNTAEREGGGIYNSPGDEDFPPGAVTLDGASAVTGNTPDDCVGTPAC